MTSREGDLVWDRVLRAGESATSRDGDFGTPEDDRRDLDAAEATDSSDRLEPE